ncbi:gluconeogenesis factor YvcK family protein [Aneurinibacillus tyrosinisolvens]|uniref:gluconeogenesis factor YvcK family protein n=1 Tax=Aneurinibacillus tyrosinisolvens TaxID=1443435 RepID=UPI00063F8E55|nr:YvcK family protein [Aneurinibacillus tyrosinisolvens]
MKIQQNKPRVVVIGGGTGLSVLLRGLKHEPIDITAIVTVADDGGSSGRLRSELHMPPPGDIRNVLVSLADTEPLLESLLQHRFVNGNGLAGHSIGNLLIAALTEISGDFVGAIEQLSHVLAVRGRVLPAANHSIVLHAEMEDGTIVSGESIIPKSGKRIKRVFIDRENVHGLQEAIDALKQADAILIGPGSLYTSILPNLLVPGIVEAIRESKAVKAYISNVMTQPGETDRYQAEDHIQAIHDHVGNSLFQHVIVNNGTVTDEVRAMYAAKGSEPVAYSEQNLMAKGYHIIADNLLIYDGFLRHDAVKLSQIIMELIGAKA